MIKLIFILLGHAQFLLAGENAFMSLVSKYQVPEDKELIVKEQLDMSENAIKSKSFVRNKYYNMKHIKFISMFHESKDPQKKYLVSFYFHGGPNEFAIKVSPVDLRKFFHKKINIETSKNQCSKLIQSHFEEYNRKSMVFFQDKERLSFETNNEFSEMAIRAKENANLKKNPSPVFVITNNCRGIGNFEYEWPGLIKGHFFIPPKFLDELMGDYDQAILGNSSKEIPLNHINSHTELKTTKFYSEQIDLSGWRGFKNKIVQWFSAYKDPVYQWYDLGDFDQVSKNCPINSIEESIVKKDVNSKIIELPVRYVTGPIPYQEFTAETRMKSGAVYMQESLAYTKTPCSESDFKKTIPNFQVPEGEGTLSKDDFWRQTKCAVIPHFFASYEDILNYPVHLSMFEVDGVYTGRSRNEYDPVITSFDKGLQKEEKKRVPYEFSKFIASYNKASIENNNNYLTVKLLNKDKNIIIGNISIDKLLEEEKKPLFVTSFDGADLYESNVVGITALFGINPRPLASSFNSSFDPDFLDEAPAPFALFYNDNGKVLNHHLPSIGVEQWYARKRGCNLVIDLISHERILPLARMELSYFCDSKK